LLVVQDVAREAGQALVGADTKLADTARALIDREHLAKQFLSRGCRRLDDTPGLELQPYAPNPRAAVEARELERDLASGAVFDGGGVDLAIRDVVSAVPKHVAAPPRAESEIGAVADESDLASALEPL